MLLLSFYNLNYGTQFAIICNMDGVRFAVCCFNRRVSPLINHSKEIFITSLTSKKRPVTKKIHISNLTPPILIDILKSQNVKLVICGGIQEEYRKALIDNNIECIENIIGGIEGVVTTYLNGNLRSNSVLN